MATGYDFQSLILFESEDYLVINKPPNIATLADRNSPDNLLELARNFNENLQVCHRLDKATSGILVFAHNPAAYRNFSIQLQQRSIQKTYHAVINGTLESNEVTVAKPLLITKKGKVTIDHIKGKSSKTSFRIIEQYRHCSWS
jgi:23S rRNA pseudouridine955/2504/2580 synthase